MMFKYILYLIFIPLILILAYGGCGDDCANCSIPLPRDCTSIEDVIVSECIGETLSKNCLGFGCETDPRANVPIGAILFCVEIDCSSMECGDTIFTDLDINEENEVTATVIDDGVDLGNASCFFFQN